MVDKENNQISETEILDKALTVLSEALDGKVVNPDALDTAIRMLQFFWSSVYSDRARERQMIEALRNKWSDTIENKDDE